MTAVRRQEDRRNQATGHSQSSGRPATAQARHWQRGARPVRGRPGPGCTGRAAAHQGAKEPAMSHSAATAETRNQGGVTIAEARPPARWAPLTGIAFVVFFLGGVVASNAPSDDASAASWIAAYTGGGR